MNQLQSAPAVSRHSAVLHHGVRPGWPAETVAWLLGSPRHDQRLAVLDLGAGTGLGTRTVAALGHSVTAVDTSASMLSVLQKSAEALPPEVAARIRSVSGSAERIPLEDHSVDAIVCLQAWHWVNPARAAAECHRVLRENGMVGLAWHTWDRTNAWVKALTAIVEPDGPPADQTSSVPEDLAGRGAFTRKNFHFDYELTVEQLVQLAGSWAFVAERADRTAVLAQVRNLGELAKSPATGVVGFPHVTAAFRLQQPTAGLVG